MKALGDGGASILELLYAEFFVTIQHIHLNTQ